MSSTQGSTTDIFPKEEKKKNSSLDKPLDDKISFYIVGISEDRTLSFFIKSPIKYKVLKALLRIQINKRNRKREAEKRFSQGLIKGSKRKAFLESIWLLVALKIQVLFNQAKVDKGLETAIDWIKNQMFLAPLKEIWSPCFDALNALFQALNPKDNPITLTPDNLDDNLGMGEKAPLLALDDYMDAIDHEHKKHIDTVLKSAGEYFRFFNGIEYKVKADKQEQKDLEEKYLEFRFKKSDLSYEEINQTLSVFNITIDREQREDSIIYSLNSTSEEVLHLHIGNDRFYEISPGIYQKKRLPFGRFFTDNEYVKDADDNFVRRYV